jgi:hypothetical protein
MIERKKQKAEFARDFVAERLAEIMWRQYQGEHQMEKHSENVDTPHSNVIRSNHETKGYHHR